MIMRLPFVFIGLSLTAFLFGLVRPEYDYLVFLGMITGVAALMLLIPALLRAMSGTLASGGKDDAQGPLAVLDGSNIMHWKKGEPDLEPVREVIATLAQHGYRAGVVFDANAGYKLEGRYRHHQVLARKLGLPQDRVMVVNKGDIADGMILRVAQDFEARVVSNDRFRDWREEFPQVDEPGFLICGSYRDGTLQLNL